MDIISILIYVISSLTCCCLPVTLIIFFIVGFMFFQKKGKKATVGETMSQGAKQVSQVFQRGGKTREELLAEEDEELRR